MIRLIRPYIIICNIYFNIYLFILIIPGYSIFVNTILILYVIYNNNSNKKWSDKFVLCYYNLILKNKK